MGRRRRTPHQRLWTTPQKGVQTPQKTPQKGVGSPHHYPPPGPFSSKPLCHGDRDGEPGQNGGSAPFSWSLRPWESLVVVVVVDVVFDVVFDVVRRVGTVGLGGRQGRPRSPGGRAGRSAWMSACLGPEPWLPRRQGLLFYLFSLVKSYQIQ